MVEGKHIMLNKKTILVVLVLFILTGCGPQYPVLFNDNLSTTLVPLVNDTINESIEEVIELTQGNNIKFLMFDNSNPILIYNENDLFVLNPGSDIQIIGEINKLDMNITNIIYTNYNSFDASILNYLTLKFNPKEKLGISLISEDDVTPVYSDKLIDTGNLSIILKPSYKESFIDEINQNILLTQIINKDNNEVTIFLDNANKETELKYDWADLLSANNLIVNRDTSLDIILFLNTRKVYTYETDLDFQSIGIDTIQIEHEGIIG